MIALGFQLVPLLSAQRLLVAAATALVAETRGGAAAEPKPGGAY